MANAVDETDTSTSSTEAPIRAGNERQDGRQIENGDASKVEEARPAEWPPTNIYKVDSGAGNENIVYWDRPEDCENPMNWSSGRKLGNLLIVSLITLITSLALLMFAPGVSLVTAELHVKNIELSSFVVSVYLLGFAFGPLVFSPLSEVYGRLPVYYSCNILFVVFSIACALSTNLDMLIGFRFLAGCAGSAPLTLGGGTIGDLIPREKRGAGVAVFALGPLLGLVIGPLGGGFLSQAIANGIKAGAVQLLAFAFMQEIYPVVLLEQKAKLLRRKTGNDHVQSALSRGSSHKELFCRSIIRPMGVLLDPCVFFLAAFMAVTYGYLYLLLTTFPTVFTETYGFATGIVGLSYMGLGIGFLVGVGICGVCSDRIVKHMIKSEDNKPEHCLSPLLMAPGAFCIPVGLFLYGWSVEQKIFWIVPIIGTVLTGAGILTCFMPIQTYMADAFTEYSASALAVSVVMRSILGAVLPLAGQSMYKALGLGWGNSLLAFIALVMSPIPLIFYTFGEKIWISSAKRQANW